MTPGVITNAPKWFEFGVFLLSFVFGVYGIFTCRKAPKPDMNSKPPLAVTTEAQAEQASNAENKNPDLEKTVRISMRDKDESVESIASNFSKMQDPTIGSEKRKRDRGKALQVAKKQPSNTKLAASKREQKSAKRAKGSKDGNPKKVSSLDKDNTTQGSAKDVHEKKAEKTNTANSIEKSAEAVHTPGNVATAMASLKKMKSKKKSGPHNPHGSLKEQRTQSAE